MIALLNKGIEISPASTTSDNRVVYQWNRLDDTVGIRTDGQSKGDTALVQQGWCSRDAVDGAAHVGRVDVRMNFAARKVVHCIGIGGGRRYGLRLLLVDGLAEGSRSLLLLLLKGHILVVLVSILLSLRLCGVLLRLAIVRLLLLRLLGIRRADRGLMSI